MQSGCGKYTLIFNGEIYNSNELKEELAGYRYEFRSHSDTEVLLTAYIHWGKNCLEKLNGMFAFIVYSQEQNKVFVARDRFGVKPLYYYYMDESSIAFASEIKQFSKLECWTPILNRRRAVDYLNWGQTDHTAETLFQGVYQIPAAHFIEFSVSSVPSSLVCSRWYSVDSKPCGMRYTDSVEKFRELFISSVQRRLKADVPVGTCLSGGLDSSSIVCAVNELVTENQSQVTFSSVSRYKQYDERVCRIGFNEV